MIEGGWVKLWRKSLDSAVWQNQDLWRFWTWCLMKATRRPRIALVGFQEIPLKPGQFVMGRDKAAEETGMTSRKVRTCLKHLKNLKNVTSKTTNKFTVITITNWHSYQSSDTQSDQQNDQEATSRRPAGDQQGDHRQEVKKEKKGKSKSKEYSASGSADAGNGNGNGSLYITKKGRKITDKRLATFNELWAAFGYKKGKAEAADSWLDVPPITDTYFQTILEAARREDAIRPDIIRQGRTPKMLQGWITGRRWEDEEYELTGGDSIDAWLASRQADAEREGELAQ